MHLDRLLKRVRRKTEERAKPYGSHAATIDGTRLPQFYIPSPLRARREHGQDVAPAQNMESVALTLLLFRQLSKGSFVVEEQRNGA
jgi:hypothetical protein